MNDAAVMHKLKSLGWDWHDNGVVIWAMMDDGRRRAIFVPIRRVWVQFEDALQAVGCPDAGSVGCIGPRAIAVGYPGQLSVGGLFDFVKKAVSKAGSVAKRLVPKAIQKAASRVVATAKRYGGAAIRGAQAIGRSPVFRGAVIAASFAVPALAPAAAALEIANRAAGYYQQAQHAAKQIQAGMKTASNIAAVARGLQAKKAIAGVIARAQRGDPRARQVMGAFQHHLVNAERAAPGGAQALRYAQGAMRNLPRFGFG
jgi:hypothetical protein